LPEGVRIYAVGDIHGRDDLLELCLLAIEKDLTEFPAFRPVLVFLGDYIDRGPASRQVVDRLIECDRVLECVLLKGNHELVAMRCLADAGVMGPWLELGGAQTLMSYGVVPVLGGIKNDVIRLRAKFQSALPPSHFAFLRNLRTNFSCGDFLFVHAGINPNYRLAQQNDSDFLWIREPFLSSTKDFERVVVHGHTPVEKIDVRRNRIGIDTGAYATGHLTCLILEADKLAYLDISVPQT
jgi:serine/threonine protein phosphatase 1